MPAPTDPVEIAKQLERCHAESHHVWIKLALLQDMIAEIEGLREALVEALTHVEKPNGKAAAVHGRARLRPERSHARRRAPARDREHGAEDEAKPPETDQT